MSWQHNILPTCMRLINTLPRGIIVLCEVSSIKLKLYCYHVLIISYSGASVLADKTYHTPNSRTVLGK